MIYLMNLKIFWWEIMLDYVNSEPFIFMTFFDKCEVYFESKSFGDRDLIYKNVRDSVICFLYRNSFYKIVSWGISKKYKYSTLYFIVIQSLD